MQTSGHDSKPCGQLENVMQTSGHDSKPSARGYTSNGTSNGFLTTTTKTYQNGNGVMHANGSLNGTLHSNGNGVHGICD